jgi:hypothetical protein
LDGVNEETIKLNEYVNGKHSGTFVGKAFTDDGETKFEGTWTDSKETKKLDFKLTLDRTTDTENAPNLITTAGVDIFHYDDSIPFKNKDYTIVQDTFYQDGGEWLIYSVFQDGEKILTIHPGNNEIGYGEKPDGRISSLTVLSNKFATAEGMRVGSTIEEFFRMYPNSNVFYGEVSGDFGVSFQDESPKRSIYAELSLPENFVYPEDVWNVKMSDFKGAKIGTLTVHGN